MMRCKRSLLEAFALYLQTVEQETKIVQGLPKLWANFRDLIGIFSQSVRPSRAIWTNRVQFSLDEAALAADQLHPRSDARRLRRDERLVGTDSSVNAVRPYV